MGLAKRLNQIERTLSKPPTEAAGTCLWAAYDRSPQTYRFLQQHPQVVHSTVLVITPHDRLNLGPTEALRVFLDQQLRWMSVDELSREPDHCPLLVGL